MSSPRPLRSTALRVLICFVVASAVLGAIASISGGEWLTEKVLPTSLCVLGASVFALIGIASIGRRGTALWAFLTSVAGLVGFGLLLQATWSETRISREAWRVVGSSFVVAVASAIVMLLGAARLRAGHLWVRRATYALTLGFAALILYAIWVPDEDETLARVAGTLGALALGGILTVPILARMGQAQGEVVRVGLGALARYCPACGHGVEQEGNPLKCRACGRSFRVTFEGEAASPFQ